MSERCKFTFKLNNVFSSIFILLVTGLLACSKDDDCDAGGGYGNTAEIYEFTWKNTQVQMDSFPYIYYRFKEIEDDSLIFNEYAIQVIPFMNYYNAQVIPKSTFSLFPAAYACSFIPPLTEEVLLDIQITSDKAMDDDHPAGANLSHFFDINVRDWRDDINSGLFDLDNYIQINRRVPEEIAFLLKNLPAGENAYTFTVQFFTDGREGKFGFTTTPVFLLLPGED